MPNTVGMDSPLCRHHVAWRRSCIAMLLFDVLGCFVHLGVRGAVAQPPKYRKANGKFVLKKTDTVKFKLAQRRNNIAEMNRYDTFHTPTRNPRPPSTLPQSEYSWKRNMNASKSDRSRTVIILGANHKTGTWFFQRASRIIKTYIANVFLCPHWDGDTASRNGCPVGLRRFTKPTKPGLNKEMADVRVLHSARDPFDMAVSALLYHRTCDEAWVTTKLRCPCSSVC